MKTYLQHSIHSEIKSNMENTQTTPKQSRIAPNQPKCNQNSMTEEGKGLEIRSDYQNRDEEVWKCDKEWKGISKRWRIEISYHNQVIHLTSKEPQNQQKQTPNKDNVGSRGCMTMICSL